MVAAAAGEGWPRSEGGFAVPVEAEAGSGCGGGVPPPFGYGTRAALIDEPCCSGSGARLLRALGGGGHAISGHNMTARFGRLPSPSFSLLSGLEKENNLHKNQLFNAHKLI